MSEELRSAAKKMGMSSCPTAFMMSIDFLLKHSPQSLKNITDGFNLTQLEVEAFNNYVNLRNGLIN